MLLSDQRVLRKKTFVDNIRAQTLCNRDRTCTFLYVLRVEYG